MGFTVDHQCSGCWVLPFTAFLPRGGPAHAVPWLCCCPLPPLPTGCRGGDGTAGPEVLAQPKEASWTHGFITRPGLLCLEAERLCRTLPGAGGNLSMSRAPRPAALIRFLQKLGGLGG